jgi:hypothetical protein
VKARIAVVVALAFALFGGAGAAAHGKSSLRKFSYSASGTNHVNIQTGELSEHWEGYAKPFGKIATDVGGSLQRPTPTTLTVQTNMFIRDRSRDLLVGACTGSGILPNPDGSEDWTCDATGGTGKFKRSRGHWTLHIEISRISIENGVQSNRFTEQGAGRLRWNGPARAGQPK